MALPRSVRLAPPPPFAITRSPKQVQQEQQTPLSKYYKAFACWVVFAVLAGYSDLLDFPDNFLPIAAHSIGFGFFLVITTNTTRWLLPVFICALVFCWAASSLVPPSWYDTVVSVFAFGWFLFVLAFVVWGVLPAYKLSRPGSKDTSSSSSSTSRVDSPSQSSVSSSDDSTASEDSQEGSGVDDEVSAAIAVLQTRVEQLQGEIKRVKDQHKQEVSNRRKAETNGNKLSEALKKEKARNESLRRELNLSKKIVESRTREVSKYKGEVVQAEAAVADANLKLEQCEAPALQDGECANPEHTELIDRLQGELTYVLEKNRTVHAFLESEEAQMMRHLNNLEKCDWETICRLEDKHLHHLQQIRLEKTRKATGFLM